MPGPYRATVPGRANSFTYGGTSYGPGSRFVSDNACQILAFAAAYQAANPDSGKADKSPNFWQSMQDACPAGDGGTPTDAPSTAPIEANPGQTEGDSAENQGAPAQQ